MPRPVFDSPHSGIMPGGQLRMTRLQKLAIIGGAIVALFIVLGSWGCKGRREASECRKRQADVDARVRALKQAVDKVPVGATKEDVVRFFAAIGMTPDFSNFSDPIKDATSDATGTEFRNRCAPLKVCGDGMIIQVRVMFDRNGRVVSHDASAGYISCP